MAGVFFCCHFSHCLAHVFQEPPPIKVPPGFSEPGGGLPFVRRGLRFFCLWIFELALQKVTEVRKASTAAVRRANCLGPASSVRQLVISQKIAQTMMRLEAHCHEWRQSQVSLYVLSTALSEHRGLGYSGFSCAWKGGGWRSYYSAPPGRIFLNHRGGDDCRDPPTQIFGKPTNPQMSHPRREGGGLLDTHPPTHPPTYPQSHRNFSTKPGWPA